MPVEVVGATYVVAVSAGESHTCALHGAGTMSCWGWNVIGMLGDGTTADSPTPVPVAGVSDAVQLDLGYQFACALRATGQVVCWGNNSSGQLGDGTSGTERHAPTLVLGLSDAVQVAAGNQHACAVRATGGVVCWGNNSYGELGDGTFDLRSTPVAVAGLADVAQIAVGNSNSCARLRSGGVRGRYSRRRVADGSGAF